MIRNQLYFRSSSFKMALLFTLLLSAVVLCLGYFIYDFGREVYQRDSEAALDALVSTVLLERKLDQETRLENILENRLGDQEDTYYLLADVAGNRIAGNLAGFPEQADRIVEGVILFESPRVDSEDNRHHKLAAKIQTFPDGRQLLVARDIEPIAKRFARVRLLSLFSIFSMLAVITVSFLISIFVVTRINRMSSIALKIMETGDLSKRLSIDSRWDDLSFLSRVLNEMLVRIEELVSGIKSVSDNIAHDLRTPLTRVRNQLEKSRESGMTPASVESLMDEVDQLLETFRSILRISRMESGQDRASFAMIELPEILRDVVELYEPLAEENDISLTLSVPDTLNACGDRHLLFQAFANLLDNAIKHAGAGASVFVTCRPCDQNAVEIILEDSGPGIPDKDKERVFERFYRCDTSRSTRGSGLGLSLVAAVIHLHRAAIRLEDVQPTGLRVVISLPRNGSIITNS